jgi:hypothetical protein
VARLLLFLLPLLAFVLLIATGANMSLRFGS